MQQMEIWLVILFLSRKKFHAKQIGVLNSATKSGPGLTHTTNLQVHIGPRPCIGHCGCTVTNRKTHFNGFLTPFNVVTFRKNFSSILEVSNVSRDRIIPFKNNMSCWLPVTEGFPLMCISQRQYCKQVSLAVQW